jgi:hypothetical protein
LKPVLDDYDFVLIDCPPNLGLITLNGLRIANGYIIPTIPDVLSTYGIPQIVTRIKSFADNIREPIEPYGIVVTKYQANSSVHNRTLKQLRDDRKKVPTCVLNGRSSGGCDGCLRGVRAREHAPAKVQLWESLRDAARTDSGNHEGGRGMNTQKTPQGPVQRVPRRSRALNSGGRI